HDDDFAVERVFRADVGVGGKKFSERARNQRTDQDGKTEYDGTARLLGQRRKVLRPIGSAFFKVGADFCIPVLGGLVRFFQDLGASSILLPCRVVKLLVSDGGTAGNVTQQWERHRNACQQGQIHEV